MDNFYSKPSRREIRDLQIAPILDMLVAVIFFLLLSTSFLEFTKQTIPPSGVKTITDPVAPPPVNPKLYVNYHRGQMTMMLRWEGLNSGADTVDVSVGDPTSIDQSLISSCSKMVTEFKKKFPGQSSLTLSFGEGVPYQSVISVMDGVREMFPDLILGSYEEAKAMAGQ